MLRSGQAARALAEPSAVRPATMIVCSMKARDRSINRMNVLRQRCSLCRIMAAISPAVMRRAAHVRMRSRRFAARNRHASIGGNPQPRRRGEMARARSRLSLCCRVALALGLIAVAVAPVRAAWPERPITIIVHFPPGGANDLLGRLIAAELAPVLGQSVVVENRPGANGNIGLTAAARAAPDGYTLVVASGVVLINPSINKVAYDPIKDFAPVAFLGASPNVLLTRTGSPVTSVAELVQKAKAEPGKITYSTP